MQIDGSRADFHSQAKVNGSAALPGQSQVTPKQLTASDIQQALEQTPEQASSDLDNLFAQGSSGIQGPRLDQTQGRLEGFDYQAHQAYLRDPNVLKRETKFPGDNRTWTEVQPQKKPSYAFTDSNRPVDDGKGPWQEVRTGSRHLYMRTYEECGVTWVEVIEGNNRYRYVNGGNEGITREIKQRHPQPQTLSVNTTQGCIQLKVYGDVSAPEMGNLRTAIERIPAQARNFLQGVEIVVAPRIGQVMRSNSDDWSTASEVAGTGGPGQIMLLKSQLASLSSLQYVLYHELGHVVDLAQQPARSSRAPWGDGRSVSPYGNTNHAEDYAEVHRVVLESWDLLSSLDARGWARQPAWEKKHEIFSLHGGNPPSRMAIRMISWAQRITN